MKRIQWLCALAAILTGLSALLYEMRRTCVFHNGFALDQNGLPFLVVGSCVIGLMLLRPWAWAMAALFICCSLIDRPYGFDHPTYDPLWFYLSITAGAAGTLAFSFRLYGVRLGHLFRAFLSVPLMFYAVMLFAQYQLLGDIHISWLKQPSIWAARWAYSRLDDFGPPCVLLLSYAFVELFSKGLLRALGQLRLMFNHPKDRQVVS